MEYKNNQVLFANDLNNLTNAISKDYIINGFSIDLVSNTLQIIVNPGRSKVNDYYYRSTISNTLNISSPDTLLPRKDIVVLSTSGSSIINGNPDSASPSGFTGVQTVKPVPPTVPVGNMLLAELWINPGSSSLSSSDVTDKRVLKDFTIFNFDNFQGTNGSEKLINAQSILNPGESIFILPGTYDITQTVTISTQLNLFGSGDQTVFKAVSSLNSDLIQVPASGSNLYNFSLDGNRTLQITGYGLKLLGSSITAQNVNARNICSGGIIISGANNLVIGGHFENNKNEDIEFSDSTLSTVFGAQSNNSAIDASRYAFWAYESKCCSFINCNFSSSISSLNGFGIAEDCYFVKLIGCSARGTLDKGFTIKGVFAGTIFYSQIEDCSATGASVGLTISSNSYKALITGNIMLENTINFVDQGSLTTSSINIF